MTRSRSKRARSPARPTPPCVATYGETSVLATVVFEKKAEARPGLLPADRALPGEDLRRGQDPGRLLQARGAPVREGGADLPADRPADPAALRRGLQERGPGHRHRALLRHGERPRHRRHDRRLGRADALRRALHGPDRRGARRLRRRRLRAEPGRRRHGEAARQPRAAARPHRRRHQGRGDDGRVRGLRALRGRDARRGQVRPRADAAGDRPDHRHGRGRRARSPSPSTRPTTRALYEQAKAARRRGDARRLRRPRQAASARTPSPPPRTTILAGAHRGGAGRPEPRRGASRSSSPTWCAGTSSTTAAASTAATSSPSARSSPRSASCRAPTARRSSPAARPRRWSSPPSAPATTSR